jgi:putative mRNA 3-end processing factor
VSGDLVVTSGEGLYCRAGDFHIDPWRPVPRAVITHAHGDHARPGSGAYWVAEPGTAIARIRLGEDARIMPLAYAEAVELGRTRVSLHAAGHVLGSAQVRIECADRVAVVSGDFKRDADPTCAPFEPIACDTFVTEATFALPVYRWPDASQVVRELREWWLGNRERGETSIVCCYALGKAQRILAELSRLTDETVYIHGALAALTAAYREAGVAMAPTARVVDQPPKHDFRGALVLAPPAASRSPWMKRFRPAQVAFASGWMRIRGNRRRLGYDRGFVLSDHADWPGLVATIEQTGARRVLATHGYTDGLILHLRAQGIDAGALATPYGDEEAPNAQVLAAESSAEGG